MSLIVFMYQKLWVYQIYRKNEPLELRLNLSFALFEYFSELDIQNTVIIIDPDKDILFA